MFEREAQVAIAAIEQAIAEGETPLGIADALLAALEIEVVWTNSEEQ